MSKSQDLIIKTIGGVGVLILNRPKALNSLNLSIVSDITAAMKEWESKKTHVVIKGAGDRAFCSGADIKWLVLKTKQGGREGYDFFRTEYNLNAYINSYKIPYVALVDGVLMGGGVGLSVHGKYRIATEKTLFSMPESTIGLFSDVGTTHFLSRLQGNLGMYLALTGARLSGTDVVQANIATHFCEKSKLQDLENEIYKCSGDEDLKTTFKKYCTDKSKLPPLSIIPLLPKINHCFGAPTVEEIIKRLEQDKSEWAKGMLKEFKYFSPTSVKVTFKLTNLASEINLKQCLQIEYRLAVSCLEGNDFAEGVRALLLDKDRKPKWKPPTYEEVTEEVVSKQFRKLQEDLELKFNF